MRFEVFAVLQMQMPIFWLTEHNKKNETNRINGCITDRIKNDGTAQSLKIKRKDGLNTLQTSNRDSKGSS